MCFFPYLIPLLVYLRLLWLCYKTPGREGASCLASQASSPSVPLPLNLRLRFMFPRFFVLLPSAPGVPSLLG